MATPRYRANVAAILRRADGKILIGERMHIPGAWQFPQGGVKRSETLHEALHRELKEEISLSPKSYRLIESKGPYRYVFPPGRTKEGFDGQEQTYFLVEFTGATSNLDVDTETPEFMQFRWIDPNEFNIGWVPDFKREVYRKVFADFFGVILGS
ncbi:MAG TPA: NUDIX domain-containing protein [Chthoniobacterales bacterium]|jgi:putative (di)nucleoside polyphosphate hydrolase|nr:NUDIX domain-containing protein [Chthoniobacterales bacterium]